MKVDAVGVVVVVPRAAVHADKFAHQGGEETWSDAPMQPWRPCRSRLLTKRLYLGGSKSPKTLWILWLSAAQITKTWGKIWMLIIMADSMLLLCLAMTDLRGNNPEPRLLLATHGEPKAGPALQADAAVPRSRHDTGPSRLRRSLACVAVDPYPEGSSP